jgi:hypothetical protein
VNRRSALMRLVGGLGAALATAIRPAAAADRLRFQDLYGSFGPIGFEFSETARRLRGQPVVMRGYLAPPLKAEARFFVLCSQPVTLCPFCQSDADWPQDIVVVYPKRAASLRSRGTADAMDVAGIFDLGSQRDTDSGFVSQARIIEATIVPA